MRDRNSHKSFGNEVLILVCPVFMELEIELLTGRTHRTRGQLSAIGYPLVGDLQYGLARTVSHPERECLNLNSEHLALQCCEPFSGS